MAVGTHNFTATDTDAAGNTSVASAPLAVTVDDGGGGGTPATPDLTESVSVVGSTTVAAGAGMTISSTVSNLGSGASPASTAGIYLSTDATITTSDTLLATVASPQLGAGSVDTKNLSLTLPANLAAGTYYIGGIADYNNQVAETTGGNNNGNAVAITVGGGGTPTNLMVNGDFETGNFTGWTIGRYQPEQTLISPNDHSGQFAAALGPAGGDGSLSQDLATTPGQHYTLDFWLANMSTGANDFTVKWGETTVMGLANQPAQGYTEYRFDVVATSSTTHLEFDYRQDPTQWRLDDVSVVAADSNLDDVLKSDGGNNVLVGGAGVDTVSYENATAGVTVSLAITSAQDTVGAGIDTLSGFENLTGSNFNDMLTGTNGNNVLIGLAGNDTLIGLAGNDTLTGGRGADTFVFSDPGFGKDTITDFSASRDVMQFSPALFANYSAAMAGTKQVGADTVITFDANDTVTLANVSASSLSSTNFRFA